MLHWGPLSLMVERNKVSHLPDRNTCHPPPSRRQPAWCSPGAQRRPSTVQQTLSSVIGDGQISICTKPSDNLLKTRNQWAKSSNLQVSLTQRASWYFLIVYDTGDKATWQTTTQHLETFLFYFLFFNKSTFWIKNLVEVFIKPLLDRRRV